MATPADRFRRRSLWLSVVAASMVALCGCGGTGKVPVRGTVVFEDGSPAKEMAGGTVIFELIGGTVSARGEIQPDGTFQLTTEKKNDGVLPGRHRVAVTEPPPEDFDHIPPPIIDPKYHRLSKSGIEVEVGNEPAEVTIRVHRNPKRKK